MVGTNHGLVRRWTGLTAVACVAVLALAVPAIAQQMDHGHDADGILPPGEWTEQQVMDAVHLVERTETAMEKFADVTKLPELGYANFGVTAPGGWDHWGKVAYNEDGRELDPDFPESLVFRSVGPGEWRLEAAMFMAEEFGEEGIPEKWRWLPGWHDHPDLCVDENGRFVTVVGPNGQCSGGHVPEQRRWMTHVWVTENACGHRFAGVGVGGLHCDDHGHGPEMPPGTWFPGPYVPGATMPPGSVPMPAPVEPVSPTTQPAPSHPKAPPATPVKAKPRYTG